MRWREVLLLACASSFSDAALADQKPLIGDLLVAGGNDAKTLPRDKKLHGKFLHITDIHPDPFYKVYSSTEEEDACHRGKGPAGVLGAETTDCDSPFTLVNATFKWIEENIKDSIDFIIWGGDSARHDNDELIPRTDEQIVDQNMMLVDKFLEVFGKKDRINDTDPTYDFIVPIIPTFGNNDILPHNIMDPGPSKWTKTFLSIWRQFIPEEQRHGFERGGWFYVEVIPNQLAVFNLNTLYFHGKNAAVNGCADKFEIGYEEMDWLRIQLQFMRQRGMKAIIMGHVPPGRSETKRSWDETCWQKYTLWMRQYRDVVVGSMYGHMNFEHFLLQDLEELDEHAINGDPEPEVRTALDGELSIQSTADYLNQLRTRWSRIPNPEGSEEQATSCAEQDLKSRARKKRPKKSKKDKFYEKIGGPWGERYSLTLVSASVVPNYFPVLRVFEYNTTGLDSYQATPLRVSDPLSQSGLPTDEPHPNLETNGKLQPKYKKHKFIAPLPPSKSSPPGPAYSPQTFTWLSYKQYYANLTNINNDSLESNDPVDADRWHSGKHSGKTPHGYNDPAKHAKKFAFEVEYDTKTDKAYALKDLTVRSWVDLAGRIGQYRSCRDDNGPEEIAEQLGHQDVDVDDEDDYMDKYLDNDLTPSRSNQIQRSNSKKHKKNKKDKKDKAHEKRKAIEKAWFAFASRAFVSTRDEDDLLENFG